MFNSPQKTLGVIAFALLATVLGASAIHGLTSYAFSTNQSACEIALRFIIPGLVIIGGGPLFILAVVLDLFRDSHPKFKELSNARHPRLR